MNTPGSVRLRVLSPKVLGWLRAAVRGLIGLLFLFAGASKLAAREAFFSALMEYRLLEANAAYGVAGWLPVLEIVVGFGLLVNRPRRLWPWGGAGLLVVFTAAIFSAWIRGLDISCACLGPLEIGGGPPVWVARNLILIAALLWSAGGGKSSQRG